MISRKQKFTYKAPHYIKKFQDTDILYLGVFSESGCSFEMTVTVPLPEKKGEVVSGQKEPTEDFSDYDDALEI